MNTESGIAHVEPLPYPTPPVKGVQPPPLLLRPPAGLAAKLRRQERALGTVAKRWP